jgi:hypothetical protein
MSVPRCEEKIPGEPREEEPSCPIRAPVDEPYPQEHHAKESSGCTNLSWVRRHTADDCVSKSEGNVQRQEGCRPFDVSGAGSPIVICIHNFSVHVLLRLNAKRQPREAAAADGRIQPERNGCLPLAARIG